MVRAGAEFGTHTVGLDAPAEVLELTHTARSRAPFAQGALTAAQWLAGRKGVFDMDDLAAHLAQRIENGDAPASSCSALSFAKLTRGM